ncbi:phosphatidylinositol n-acetylglucosaminyltransferase [Babesia ovis]|uniref:Phosphatidylinositol n-acetylglucosaminyltransferase n=1 Tax=Babesia ovis TaxID=5869 RepID=A0A9W5TAC3_BABOV|nr:phosphatidylinositol n-acetylglucosaminyltransferase [Babesia ovis]
MLTDAEIRRQSSLSKSGADEWENVSACGTDDDAPLPPWERVMYKTQPYPPNYVSDDFLSGLKDNGNNSYTLGDVCPKTMILTQHCSTMILMARIFILIKDDIIPLEYVEIAAMLAILFFCLVMYLTRATQSDRFQHVRFAFVVHVTLQILQPVLQTLTSSFTYDTIYALAILISLINILTQDYELTGSDDAYVKNVDPLPMNCLILVAILISSRFGSSQKATAYMQLYVMTFTMLPLLQRFMMVGFKSTVTQNIQRIGTVESRPGATKQGLLIGRHKKVVLFTMALDESQLLCKYTTSIKFTSERFCQLVLKVLNSEAKTHEDRATVVYTGEGSTLDVAINAVNARTLRLKVNAFYETCYLVSSILETFPANV